VVPPSPWSTRPFARRAKRLIDVLGAGTAVVVLSPVLGAVALAVRLRMGRPVLFVQQRPGRDGELFEMWKFRTMTDERDATGALLPDAERLTAVGRFLRRTSLDELPELFNVLRGEMSLVGPRPLLPQYLSLYSPDQRRRHQVPPGITGWCQINGRNALSWEEKFDLDLWYVDNWSFGLDLRILASTVGAVLTGRGISAEGHATTPYFQGPAVPPGHQEAGPS
jgi:sugar transferase EpsL